MNLFWIIESILIALTVVLIVVFVVSGADGDEIGGLFGAFFIFSIINLFLVFLISVGVDYQYTTKVEKTTYELKALKDNQTQESSGYFIFVVGQHSSTTKLNYHFLYKTENGYKMGQLSPTDQHVYIREGVDKPLYIVEQTFRKKIPNKGFKSLLFFNKNLEWIEQGVPVYTLQVPEGTITHEFEVNLE